jgi:hypothetical protein
MTLRAADLSASALRHLQRALLTTSDQQLARIVGVLDKLEGRGGADALIAPMRGRLAQLRPARPLTFARLLFIPIDPLLVPGPVWTRGRLGVPRTALLPMAAQARAELRELADEVDAMIRGGRADDAALVRRAGTLLWPAAAAVLDRIGPPTDWLEATGLGGAEYATIARCAASVLSEAVWIHATIRASTEGLGPDADELRAWLEAATSRHPEPPGALLAVLLARLPEAVVLIESTPSQPVRSAAQAEPAIDFLLDRLEASPQPSPDPIEAEAEVQRAVALLNSLETPGPSQRPSRKPRTEQLRRRLDERCRARFAENLARQVLTPLTETTVPGDMESLEEAARGLRRLELVGRQLGGEEHYDRMLRTAARQVGEDGPGSRVERARLVEILAGTDAALTLLRR